MTGHPANDNPPTLGVRRASGGTILREPVGFSNRDEPLAWTHGICRDSQKRFQDDALLPAQAIRDTQKSHPSSVNSER
jgi:hypothetical protein